MPRARVIRPSFFTSEVVADLDPLTRLLFIGLWQLADRDGKLEDRPRRIAAAVLPFDGIDGDARLGELEAADLLVRYEADGRPLLYLPTFTKHQNPHARETASVLPYPPEVVQEHSLGPPEANEGALDLDLDPDLESTPPRARARKAADLPPVLVALYALHRKLDMRTLGPRADTEIKEWSEYLTVDDVKHIEEESNDKPWAFAAAIAGRVAAARASGSEPWPARDRPADGGKRRKRRGRGAGGVAGDSDGGDQAVDPSTGRPIASL